MKWPYLACIYYTKRRSRKGAWIEITVAVDKSKVGDCAPARERGLKSRPCTNTILPPIRSRKGAWIEILKKQTGKNACMRSRKGAWIEISMTECWRAVKKLKSLPQGSVD